MFKVIVINKDDSGYRASLKDVDASALPPGDVTVRVACSSINYKDSLAGRTRGRVLVNVNVNVNINA